MEINIAADWFNSRMEFQNPLVQDRLPNKLNPVRIKTMKEKRRRPRCLLGKGVSNIPKRPVCRVKKGSDLIRSGFQKTALSTPNEVKEVC